NQTSGEFGLPTSTERAFPVKLIGDGGKRCAAYRWLFAPLPKAGTFKQATRRPRTRDTQIGSDCDAALPSHKGSFVQRGPAKQLHSLVQAQSGDYLRNGLIATTIPLTPGFRGMYRSSVS